MSLIYTLILSDQSLTVMASFHQDYFVILSPNIVTPCVRASTYELVWTGKHNSINNSVSGITYQTVDIDCY